MTEHCPVSCAEDFANMDSNISQADDCEDAHPRCFVWATLGDECETNSEMMKYCAKSCNTCHMAASDDNLCRDTHSECRFWANSGECLNVSYTRAVLW